MLNIRSFTSLSILCLIWLVHYWLCGLAQDITIYNHYTIKFFEKKSKIKEANFATSIQL